jgi:hypothetical protein
MPPPDSRLIIVGWDNEKSWQLEDALEPYTPNGAGERLYKMVNSVVPIDKATYMFRIDCVNVRRIGVGRVRELMCGRPAVVLGVETWYTLFRGRGRFWITCKEGAYVVPHPSGRNRIYNSEASRLRTGRLVARLAGFA